MPKIILKSPKKCGSKHIPKSDTTKIITLLCKIIAQQHEFYKSDPKNERLYQEIIQAAVDAIAAIPLSQNDIELTN